MTKITSVHLVQKPNLRLKSTLRALHFHFSKVFGGYLPLKIGIHEDILVSVYGLTRECIEEGLDHHVNTREYLKNVVKDGSCRFDLRGNVMGEIDQKSRDFAKRKLEDLSWSDED